MRTKLPYAWRYKANLPTAPALMPKEQPAYLLALFEEAFAAGYRAAQADLREVLGLPLPDDDAC